MEIANLIVQTVIIYIIVVFGLRIMGKRQIAELEPSELVITLMVSEIATIPLQDESKGFIDAFVPVATLVIFEIIVSFIDLKSEKFRNLTQGKSVIIIHNGKVSISELRKLRYSMEDVWEALRKEGIFDLNDVQYAVAETDGTISVLPIPEKRPITPEDMKKKVNGETTPPGIKEAGVKPEEKGEEKTQEELHKSHEA